MSDNNEMELDRALVEPVLDEQAEDPVRSEAVYIRGVDNLSSREIKKYLDHYLKDTVASADQRINTFHLEWIDDSSVNVVCEDQQAGSRALIILSEDYDDSMSTTTERPGKTFYFEDSEVPQGEEENFKFFLRASLKQDKKEKNAKEKSRYYLLHGEPDRRAQRRNYNGSDYRNRDSYRRRTDRSEPDLFADKKIEFSDEDEDLFPDKVRPEDEDDEMRDERSRSPDRSSRDLSSRIKPWRSQGRDRRRGTGNSLEERIGGGRENSLESRIKAKRLPKGPRAHNLF